jgi:hypothetical protein
MIHCFNQEIIQKWMRDLFQPCVRMRDHIVMTVCLLSIRHPPPARFLPTHISILIVAAILPCKLVRPFEVPEVQWNWNRK